MVLFYEIREGVVRLYNKHLSTATETVGVERFLQRGNLVGGNGDLPLSDLG